ncbi:MAG: hypothetical protein WA092_00190 [Minisyncoccales bacterium]
MDGYQETKEAYLKVPETDIRERSSFIDKLNDLANTSAEIKDLWKTIGEFVGYLAKCKECREKILKA